MAKGEERRVDRSRWGICVGLALAAMAVVQLGLSEPLDRMVGDAVVRLARLQPPEPAAELPDVALVALDAQSLRAFPDWPWPRSLYADAIDRLTAAGAASIAFDVDFSTPRDEADDRALAEAIERSGRVVLATFRQRQALPGGGELEVASLPRRIMADRAEALGSVVMPVDPDGIVRRAPRMSRIAERPFDSLAGAALEVATGEPASDLTETLFDVDYRRALPEVPVLSIADVIDGRFPDSAVRGKSVLIGATASALQDLWPTPLGPARAGVWIQAMVYRTLAAERAGLPVLRKLDPMLIAAWIALLLGAQAAIGDGAGRRATGLAALTFVAIGGAIVAGVGFGRIASPVVPVGALALQHLFGLEAVRVRLGRRVVQGERSLAALSDVAAATTTAAATDPLSMALALLGDVIDARAVALLRVAPDGSLDGRRLDWQRRAGEPAGDLATARDTLAGYDMRVFRRQVPGGEGAGLAVYTPLRAGDQPVGVLVVERDDPTPLVETQLRTIATVGSQIALSAENLRLIDGLRSTFDSAVEAIASAVEARDGYTESHCRRLAIFSVLMAERLGIDEDEIEAIRLGALLHDVGKIGVRDEILLKPGRFDAAERAEMERHAELGHRIVLPIHGLTDTTAACVRFHHERWDGMGYPDGLAGEAIPLGARIVSIVDVWDALSTDRPYKAAYPQKKVLEILEKGRGTSFDPSLVDLFLELLQEEGEDMVALTGLRGANA
jgi:HD-GYP domain-containing protein (c-di-GMP phosphodiesterase class II)/CHASE2 domain-containing sensor protein